MIVLQCPCPPHHTVPVTGQWQYWYGWPCAGSWYSLITRLASGAMDWPARCLAHRWTVECVGCCVWPVRSGATVGQYTANRARSCASDASPPHALRCRSKSHSRVSSIWRPTPVRQSVWIAAHIAPTPSGASSTTLAPAPPNPAVEFRSHGHAVPTRFSACFSASRSLSTQRLPSRPQEVLLGL